MIKEYKQIIADIKKKIFHPIYFLFGDEAYYTDKIVSFIEENALDEGAKAFNQTVLYGKDVEIGQVIDAASRLPMMSAHQVLIVKEAQELKKIEALISYVEKAPASTLLVLAYKHKSVDKRKKFFKTIINSKNSIAHESKALRDYEIEKWLSGYIAGKKLQISPKGVQLLAEYLGTDLSKIEHEIDKLLLVKGTDTNITEADIEENIGISKEYNIFELNNALGSKDKTKCYKIVQYFNANPKSFVMPMALGTIYGFYQKIYLAKYAGSMQDRDLGALLRLHPFIAKDYKRYAANYSPMQLDRIMKLLGEYDLKSKGMGATGSTTHGEFLKEMTAKILSL
ncbi:MAG: DNA polymerase III subunit delta [Chitinophagales bacterium]